VDVEGKSRKFWNVVGDYGEGWDIRGCLILIQFSFKNELSSDKVDLKFEKLAAD
jgi:hypothetical protein